MRYFNIIIFTMHNKLCAGLYEIGLALLRSKVTRVYMHC